MPYLDCSKVDRADLPVDIQAFHRYLASAWRSERGELLAVVVQVHAHIGLRADIVHLDRSIGVINGIGSNGAPFAARYPRNAFVAPLG